MSHTHTFPFLPTLAAVVLFGAVGAAVILQDDTEPDFRDQIWVSHLPKDERDIAIFLAYFTEDNTGAMVAASEWRRYLDLFRWTAEGSKVVMDFPQTTAHVTFSVKTRICDDHLPFDYCMDITQKNRVYHFYSFKEWKIEEVAGMDEILRLRDLPPCTHGAGAHDLPIFGEGME